ncbi:MAG TPA: hypothetical protein VGO58_14590 [Chitinophagaceae bacterium]|jgi:hypothetical protein|nr:hypothetical protein [Chitinophagaceae bacterium]
MNLRETILKEHSRANCTRIVNWIGTDQRRFDELVHLFLNDEYRVIQRAGWPLGEVAVNYPSMILKHLGKLLKHVKKPGLHEAVKRNTVRLLQELTIPERYHGDVMNLCFDYLVSPTEKPAVKAFSLTVLENLSHQYPEIKQELKTIIEDRWDLETAAFRSRGKKILKS